MSTRLASAENEESVLGAVLLDAAQMEMVLPVVRPEDFFYEPNKHIYAAMVELSSEGVPIDYVTLCGRLQQQSLLHEAGGRERLINMANAVPTAIHAEHYAKTVADFSTRRRLLAAADNIKAHAVDAESIGDALSLSDNEIMNVLRERRRSGIFHMHDLVTTYLDTLDKALEAQGFTGQATGLHDLDRLLGGFHKSDLIILGARPAMGKTAIALSIAHGVSVGGGLPIAIFSLEMSALQLTERLICIESGVDLGKLRAGYVGDDDWQRILLAANTLAGAPISVVDDAGLTSADIRSYARRVHTESELALCIVDYMQLIESPTRSDNRQVALSRVSRDMKGLARELDIPVLALSQVSRLVDTREGHVPMLSDLRESGSLEQDSDLVMFLTRDEVYDPECEEPNVARLIVAKHRNGPNGEVKLFFHKPSARFRSFESRRVAA